MTFYVALTAAGGNRFDILVAGKYFAFYHNMLCVINLLIELVIAGLLLHSP